MKPESLIAAPKPPPLCGIRAALHYVNFFRDPIACMRHFHQAYGDIAALGPVSPFREIHRLHLLTAGPDYNRQVLGSPELFRTTGQTIRGPKNSSQRRLRFGLTRMQGSQHAQQRQLVMPLFHKKAVDGYRQIMVDNVDEVLKDWRPGATCDMYREMRRLSLHLSSTILFSPDPREASGISGMIEEWLQRNFSASVWLFPVNFPGTPYRRLLNHATKLEHDILSMIGARRASPAGRMDVLSLLTQARDEEGHGVTDEELVGQIAILFAASYETTASALTWILFLLAQHPRVMADLVSELEGGLPEAPARGGDALPLLDRVIKESMRILPPVPYTIRAANLETEMGGYHVPQGSRVICSHYLTHHMSELYPEPEKFLPERWLTINPSPYEYVPFSAGPRMCIGVTFAMQVMKISLAMILQRFRPEVIPGARIDRVVRVTMSPRHGMPMKLFRQDRQYRRSKICGNVREMVDLGT